MGEIENGKNLAAFLLATVQPFAQAAGACSDISGCLIHISIRVILK